MLHMGCQGILILHGHVMDEPWMVVYGCNTFESWIVIVNYKGVIAMEKQIYKTLSSYKRAHLQIMSSPTTSSLKEIPHQTFLSVRERQDILLVHGYVMDGPWMFMFGSCCMHHHGWTWLVMGMSWIVNRKHSKTYLHPKDPLSQIKKLTNYLFLKRNSSSNLIIGEA